MSWTEPTWNRVSVLENIFRESMDQRHQDATVITHKEKELLGLRRG